MARNNFLSALAQCVADVLNNDAFFSDINVFNELKGDVVADINQMFQTMQPKAGKIGAAVVILAPEVLNNDSQTARGELRISLRIECHEDMLTNHTAEGTGKRKDEMGCELLRVLQNACFPAIEMLVTMAKHPMPVESHPITAEPVYVAQFEAIRSLEVVPKVAMPDLAFVSSPGSVNVTASTATEGASIYLLHVPAGELPRYPGPASEGTLYEGPADFAVQPGDLIIAAAFKSGCRSSDMSHGRIVEP